MSHEESNARKRAMLAAAILLPAICLLSCTGAPDPQARMPNVVLISVDTLRADHLNCYGYDTRTTSPALDRLAADGILFENHIAASPWTTPSHLSLFTSLYPTAHGVTQSFRELVEEALDNRSFQRLADEHVTLAESLAERGYATAAFTGGGTLDPAIGFDQGFESYDTSMYRMNPTNAARLHSWVRDREDRPFFLFWHTFEVHAPYLHSEYLDDVLDAERAGRLASFIEELRGTTADESGMLQRQRAIATLAQRLKDERAMTREVTEALYDGGILAFDRYLERFVALLRETGLYDRTLILFTSDHGEEFGDHTRAIYDAHGHTLYEEIVRVPLVVKLPGQEAAGTRVAALNRNVDVMPTILQQAGVSVDLDRIHGSPLQPLWTEPVPPARLAFSEALAEAYEMKSLRTERYKYVVQIDAASVAEHGRSHVPEEPAGEELFDLERDPRELDNLMRQRANPEIARAAEALSRRLRGLAAMTGSEADRTELDPETVERLRSLGYVN